MIRDWKYKNLFEPYYCTTGTLVILYKNRYLYETIHTMITYVTIENHKTPTAWYGTVVTKNY